MSGRYYMVAFRISLIGFFMLSGLACEEEECKPCQTTETRTCPNVRGSMNGDIQIVEGSCDVPWGGQGNVTVNIDQTQENAGQDDERSKLIIAVFWSAGGLFFISFDGELCDTTDENFPKKYPFYGAAQDVYDDATVNYALTGDFRVFDPLEGKDPEFCGAIGITVSSEGESCSTGAILYSSEDLCD
jgi:hypothetical protein